MTTTSSPNPVDDESRIGGLEVWPLTGKVAVVTGGSSGIGAATARRLSDGGATVIVGYNRGKDRADALVAELTGAGHRSLPMPIEDSAGLEDVARQIEHDHGRCDILVNSAGMTKKVPHSDLATLDDELFDSIMRTNVRGPFATVLAFVPLMAKTGDAVIINVSSISGSTASGSNIAYCAAKAALDNMTMSLARVLGPTTRVLGVAPAAVNTGFVPGRDRQAMIDQASSTPLQIAVEPDDVALTIVGACTYFRISTGTTFVIDGGKHL